MRASFGRRRQEGAAPTWQFYFTPYLWVSGVSGTTSTSNPNIPTQTSTASFSGLLSHLNSVPIIGAFDVRPRALPWTRSMEKLRQPTGD